MARIETTKIDYEDSTSDEDSAELELDVYGIYNFSVDPINSGFLNLGLSFSVGKEEEDGSSDVDTALRGFSIGGGKRWSLASIGIDNLSYTLAAKYSIYNGDSDDGSSETDLDVSALTITFARFDLFF